MLSLTVDSSLYIQWKVNPTSEDLKSENFFQLIKLKGVFLWITYYLDNQSLFALSMTCKSVRNALVSNQTVKKAAWSLSRGIPYDPLIDLEQQELLYKKINIKFPALIRAFGSLQALKIIPSITLSVPIEQYPYLPFKGKIQRGIDANNRVFLAFRLQIKKPYTINFIEQIEVIYQVDSLWKRLQNDSLPHLTLGIQVLNDPEVCKIFTSRLKSLLSGSLIGVAEQRDTTDPMVKKIPYKSAMFNGPYSSYVTL